MEGRGAWHWSARCGLAPGAHCRRHAASSAAPGRPHGSLSRWYKMVARAGRSGVGSSSAAVACAAPLPGPPAGVPPPPAAGSAGARSRFADEKLKPPPAAVGALVPSASEPLTRAALPPTAPGNPAAPPSHAAGMSSAGAADIIPIPSLALLRRPTSIISTGSDARPPAGALAGGATATKLLPRTCVTGEDEAPRGCMGGAAADCHQGMPETRLLC